jgi:hypothetical protein
MASRRTIKAQPRQKRAAAVEAVVSTIFGNGDSATNGSSSSNGITPSFEQIQRRAYELFEARGGTHGCDLDDWFSAEQELTATSTAAH